MKRNESLPLTTPVFHILLSLVDGERHGYAIIQEVRGRTEDEIVLGPGTLYGAIKRLLEAGLIEESGDRPRAEMDDERRRYYRISTSGRAAVKAEAERLARMVDSARSKRLIGRARWA